MYSPHEQESPELRYVKENIERVERTIAEYKKKLQFETKEQLNREEQLERRQRSEMQKFETTLERKLDAFRDVGRRTLQQAETAIERDRGDLQRLQSQLEAARQKYEQQVKTDQKKNDGRDASTKEASQDFDKTPEVLRIHDQIEQINRQLRNNLAKIQSLTNENTRKEENFIRGQKREIETLQRQQEREKNSFNDTWKRAKTYLDNKIRETSLMLERFKSDYKSKEREFEIEKKRRLKMESEQRAQHGDAKAGTNYATPGKENSIDPNKGPSADSTRIESKPRW